jgi:hypothetical protein
MVDVLIFLSWPCHSFFSSLSWPFYPGCPGLAFLLWLSCTGCPALAVLLLLSCCDFLLWLSCRVPAVLLCSGCLISAVLFWLSLFLRGIPCGKFTGIPRNIGYRISVESLISYPALWRTALPSLRYRKFRYQAKSDIAHRGYQTEYPPTVVKYSLIPSNLPGV